MGLHQVNKEVVVIWDTYRHLLFYGGRLTFIVPLLRLMFLVFLQLEGVAYRARMLIEVTAEIGSLPDSKKPQEIDQVEVARVEVGTGFVWLPRLCLSSVQGHQYCCICMVSHDMAHDAKPRRAFIRSEYFCVRHGPCSHSVGYLLFIMCSSPVFSEFALVVIYLWNQMPQVWQCQVEELLRQNGEAL